MAILTGNHCQAHERDYRPKRGNSLDQEGQEQCARDIRTECMNAGVGFEYNTNCQREH